MKYYFMVTLTVQDESWVNDYIENVTKLVHKHGGNYAVRTPNVDKREGEGAAPGLAIIVEWPSKEAADAFYYDPDYEPYREARKNGSIGEFLVVPGEDVAAS